MKKMYINTKEPEIIEPTFGNTDISELSTYEQETFGSYYDDTMENTFRAEYIRFGYIK